MDVTYAYACFLSVCVLVVSFSLHFFLFKSKETDNRQVLPPGRTGWPVIGESFDYLSSGWKGHPEKFIFDRMSKFSPIVFRTSLLLENMAVFCGAQGNKFLFSNENKLVHVWWPSSFAKILPSIKTYDTDNNRTRKILQNTLKPEALQRYVPIMDVITQRHFVVGWDGKEEVVTYELATNFAFWLACKIFVSIDDLERVKYLSGPFESIVTGILSIPIDLPGTPFRRGINAANFIRKELVAIVKQRKIDLAEGKATTTQDILSHLIHSSNEDENFLGELNIADRILALLIGGYQSTSSAIAFIVKYLAELPEIYDGVYKEQVEIAKSKTPGELLNYEDLSKMKYSWNVACEVLRLVPPAQGAFREAITDFMYNGYSIPKGWKLYWSANSTHQNPEFFPEPKKFDPSRFEGKGPTPYTFVPFGGGPHKCPGNEFARLEILVFMHHLVTKYKWENMISDEQIVYNPTPTPSKGLPIRIYPHRA